MGWDSFLELLLLLLYFSAALKSIEQYRQVEVGNCGSWFRRLLLGLLSATLAAKLLLKLIFLFDIMPLQIEDGLYFLTVSALLFTLCFEAYFLYLLNYKPQQLVEIAEDFTAEPSKWKFVFYCFCGLQAAIMISIFFISERNLFSLLNNCMLSVFWLLFSSLVFLSTRTFKEVVEIDPLSRTVLRLRNKLKYRYLKILYATLLRCFGGMIVWIPWVFPSATHKVLILDMLDCILIMVTVHDTSQGEIPDEEVPVDLAQESRPRELTEKLIKDESPNRGGLDFNGVSPQLSKLAQMATPPPERNPDDITPKAKTQA